MTVDSRPYGFARSIRKTISSPIQTVPTGIDRRPCIGVHFYWIILDRTPAGISIPPGLAHNACAANLKIGTARRVAARRSAYEVEEADRLAFPCGRQHRC